MSWFVYALFCDQKTFYVGVAENVAERFSEHVKGYSPYTRKFSDFVLLYQEEYSSRREAEARERQLKRWSVAKKQALISGDKELLIKLSKSRTLVEPTDS